MAAKRSSGWIREQTTQRIVSSIRSDLSDVNSVVSPFLKMSLTIIIASVICASKVSYFKINQKANSYSSGDDKRPSNWTKKESIRAAKSRPRYDETNRPSEGASTTQSRAFSKNTDSAQNYRNYKLGREFKQCKGNQMGRRYFYTRLVFITGRLHKSYISFFRFSSSACYSKKFTRIWMSESHCSRFDWKCAREEVAKRTFDVRDETAQQKILRRLCDKENTWKTSGRRSSLREYAYAHWYDFR